MGNIFRTSLKNLFAAEFDCKRRPLCSSLANKGSRGYPELEDRTSTRRMKFFTRANVFKLLLIGFSCSSLAQELPEAFPIGAKAPAFSSRTVLSSPYTAGGYSVYQGDGRWLVIQSKETTNNLQVRIGHLRLGLLDGTDYAGEMYLMVNLNRSNEANTYYTNDFCAIKDDQLFRLNRPSGQYDNCMIIQPGNASFRSKPIKVVDVIISISKSGDRLYHKVFRINPSLAGFDADTNWNRESVSADPRKAAYISHLEAWGRELHTAADSATEWTKPTLAFSSVAPISSVIRPQNLDRQDLSRNANTGGLRTGINISGEAENRKTGRGSLSVVERLEELRQLHQKGLISTSVYEERQREILSER